MRSRSIPTSLTCDVTKLSAAVAEGRFEEAVDYYRGELLAGVHFPNAGEAFEEWLSRERARTVGLVLRALHALAERDEAAGNIAAAVRWAQRACALAPDDESWLRRSMSLLDAGDDRGSALRLYESYERRLAAEFNSKPTAESAALAARIRGGERRPRASEAPMPAASSAACTDHSRTRVEATAPDERSDSARSRTADPVAPCPVRPRHRRQVVRWALALGAAAIRRRARRTQLSTLDRTHTSRSARACSSTHSRIARTIHDSRSLGRMAEDWLTQGLLRTQLVDVVDTRAAFVQGHAANGARDRSTHHRTPHGCLAPRVGQLLSHRRYDSLPGRGRGRAHGENRPRHWSDLRDASAPLGALDELRSRVMSALASVVNVQAPETFEERGDVPPFDAYQAYIDASDAYCPRGRSPCGELFLSAAHRTPGSPLPPVAAAGVAANSGHCSLVDSIARRWSASRHLDRIERLSTQIEVAHCHGRNEEALRLTLERAELEPRTSSFRLSAAVGRALG